MCDRVIKARAQLQADAERLLHVMQLADLSDLGSCRQRDTRLRMLSSCAQGKDMSLLLQLRLFSQVILPIIEAMSIMDAAAIPAQAQPLTAFTSWTILPLQVWTAHLVQCTSCVHSPDLLTMCCRWSSKLLAMALPK